MRATTILLFAFGVGFVCSSIEFSAPKATSSQDSPLEKETAEATTGQPPDFRRRPVTDYNHLQLAESLIDVHPGVAEFLYREIGLNQFTLSSKSPTRRGEDDEDEDEEGTDTDTDGICAPNSCETVNGTYVVMVPSPKATTTQFFSPLIPVQESCLPIRSDSMILTVASDCDVCICSLLGGGCTIGYAGCYEGTNFEMSSEQTQFDFTELGLKTKSAPFFITYQMIVAKVPPAALAILGALTGFPIPSGASFPIIFDFKFVFPALPDNEKRQVHGIWEFEQAQIGGIGLDFLNPVPVHKAILTKIGDEAFNNICWGDMEG